MSDSIGCSSASCQRLGPTSWAGTGTDSARVRDELRTALLRDGSSVSRFTVSLGRLLRPEAGCRTAKQANRRTVLSLRELEPLACLRTAGLLALDRACVAGEQAEVAQLAAVCLVDLHQRARDGEPKRPSLPRLAAAGDVRLDVVLTEPVGRRERLLDRGHQRGSREIIPKRTPIDVPLATARLEVHAADRLLATADRVRDLRIGHVLLRLALREGQRLRLLRGVRMLGARIDAQLAAQHLPAQRGLGKHAVHGLLDHTLGMLGDHARERREPLVTHVARVAEVLLLLRLAASDANLGRVDDDDAVARVHVRGEHRLVLAADDARDLGREAPENHALGVDDIPILLDVRRRGAERFEHDLTTRDGSFASPVRNATRVSAATEGVFRQTRKLDRGLSVVNAWGWVRRERAGPGWGLSFPACRTLASPRAGSCSWMRTPSS